MPHLGIARVDSGQAKAHFKRVAIGGKILYYINIKNNYIFNNKKNILL